MTDKVTCQKQNGRFKTNLFRTLAAVNRKAEQSKII